MTTRQVLGKGGEAYVYGPFTKQEIGQVFKIPRQSQRLATGKKYIVKVFTSSNVFPDNIEYWDDIRDEIRNDSIILPLAIFRVPLEVIHANFRDFPKRIQLKEVFVEIQQYGGKDFFDLVFDRTHPFTLSFEEFISVWISIIRILEDLARLLINKDKIITDIKMENMVFDEREKTIRLIDVQVNDDRAGTRHRIITPDLNLTPIQYFKNTWRTSTSHQLLDIYKTKARKMYDDRSHVFYNVLREIHHDEPTFQSAMRAFTATPATSTKNRNREKFFFVLYPIFFMIISLLLYKKVRFSSVEEKKVLHEIYMFCKQTLRDRGAYPTSHGLFNKMKTIIRPFVRKSA